MLQLEMLLKRTRDYLLLIYISFFLIILLLSNAFTQEEQHFVFLANSFLEFKTYFLEMPGKWYDTVFYNGFHYWPNPPFPAVVMLPLVLLFKTFNLAVYQGYLQFFLVLAIFFVVYGISHKEGFNKKDSIYWGFAFCFATAFSALAYLPWSWQFAHVITVFLIFVSIREYLNKNRPLLIGILFALILATRFSAVLGVSFYLVKAITTKSSNAEKIKRVAYLLIPILISIAILSWYNYIRYGVITEQGYVANTVIEALQRGRSYGVFSLYHLPSNLYYLFLSSPLPVFKDGVSQVLQFPFIKVNEWGVGMFFTSPYLLYLAVSKYKTKDAKALLLTVLTICVPILLYFGIGVRQVGYRYATDFLPFLFLLLIREYRSSSKSLSLRFKSLILVTAFFDLYLFVTFFIPQ